MSKNATTLIDGKQMLIVPDGLICRKSYERTGVRVVHILKEVTKPVGLGEMLLEHIRDDGSVEWRLWKVTARRSYALQNDLPQWCSLSTSTFGTALKSSAIINLNDTIPPGRDSRYRTNSDEFLQTAKERWPAWRRFTIRTTVI